LVKHDREDNAADGATYIDGMCPWLRYKVRGREENIPVTTMPIARALLAFQ
jgi:hypothetical protein